MWLLLPGCIYKFTTYLISVFDLWRLITLCTAMAKSSARVWVITSSKQASGFSETKNKKNIDCWMEKWIRSVMIQTLHLTTCHRFVLNSLGEDILCPPSTWRAHDNNDQQGRQKLTFDCIRKPHVRECVVKEERRDEQNRITAVAFSLFELTASVFNGGRD